MDNNEISSEVTRLCVSVCWYGYTCKEQYECWTMRWSEDNLVGAHNLKGLSKNLFFRVCTGI